MKPSATMIPHKSTATQSLLGAMKEGCTVCGHAVTVRSRHLGGHSNAAFITCTNPDGGETHPSHRISDQRYYEWLDFEREMERITRQMLEEEIIHWQDLEFGLQQEEEASDVL